MIEEGPHGRKAAVSAMCTKQSTNRSLYAKSPAVNFLNKWKSALLAITTIWHLMWRKM